ncbi:hypothetical protein KAS50_00530 [bacterium]|nr:hypothetical protein [bacterium]
MEQNNTIEEPKSGLITWLFNPFYYIAGGRALIIGIAIIILAGFIGSLSNSHFDGVLDIHTGKVLPLWFDVSAGLVSWLIMGILLFITGKAVSKSRFRAVDVFGTQALARFPTIITSIATLLPGYRKVAEQIISSPSNLSTLFGTTDFIFFLAVLLITLLMIIWMVYLMYRAFSVSCNVKKGKAIAGFIAALIVGEIVSKIVFISFILRT